MDESDRSRLAAKHFWQIMIRNESTLIQTKFAAMSVSVIGGKSVKNSLH